jgi:hypothetical protein
MPINDNKYTLEQDDIIVIDNQLVDDIHTIVLDDTYQDLAMFQNDPVHVAVQLITHQASSVSQIMLDTADENEDSVRRLIESLEHAHNQVTDLFVFNYTAEDNAIIPRIIHALEHPNCKINTLSICGDGGAQTTGLTNETAIQLLQVLCSPAKTNTIRSLILTNNAIDLGDNNDLITAALLHQTGSLENITLSTMEGDGGHTAASQNDDAWLSCIATLIGTPGNQLEDIDMGQSYLTDAPLFQLGQALASDHSQVQKIDIHEAHSISHFGINELAGRNVQPLLEIDVTPLHGFTEAAHVQLSTQFAMNTPALAVTGLNDNLVAEPAELVEAQFTAMEIDAGHQAGAGLFAAQPDAMDQDDETESILSLWQWK